MSWRNTSDYRKWRNDCIEREEGRCQISGVKTGLHVHHVDSASYFPEKRFLLSNGFVLHWSYHYYFHYCVMQGTRKKCTRKDLDRFLKFQWMQDRIVK